MRLLAVRTVTSVIVVLISAVAIFCGWNFVNFSLADAGFKGDPVQATRAWVKTSGVSFDARESSLTEFADSGNTSELSKRRDEQTEMLQVRPLSSKYWLMMSEMRLVANEAPAKVAQAFEFSELTGSHEGILMYQRGLYGLAHWETFPQDAQKRLITALVATTNPLTDDQKKSFLNILAKKPESIRRDIKLALWTQGFSDKSLIAIGLESSGK